MTQEDHDAFAAAEEGSEVTMTALLTTPPTTLAGVKAMLIYTAGLGWNAEYLEEAVRAAVTSPVFAACTRARPPFQRDDRPYP